jgi:hypothetical protein
MRLLSLSATLFLLVGAAFAQERVVPFSDVSEHGSPLSLSASATFGSYQQVGMTFACKAEVSTRNVSAKPVLAFVVGFSHNSDVEAGYPNEFTEYYLFGAPMRPGETLDHEQFVGWTGTVRKPRQIEISAEELSVRGEVLFVQFADGTTWGDPDEGTSSVQWEKNAFEQLKNLVSVYESYGSAALTDKIKQEDSFTLGTLKQQYGDDPNNIGQVVDRMYKMLGYANDNLKAIQH